MKNQNNSWQEVFQDPPAQYRAKPFWSWNGKLDTDRMREQIDCFAQMGYGGFHIHSRVGLQDPYMGEKFLKCVRFCNAYAKEKGMQTWLYDEDKWPSGFGGGFVTKEERNRNKCMLLSPNRYPDGTRITGRKQPSRLTENGTATLLAAYCVELDDEGYLVDYRRVETDAKEANWFAYRVLTDAMPWFNEQAYADLLNPDVAQRLTEVTHEKYKEAIGEEFGKSVPAMFTDEPQHSMSHALHRALGAEEIVQPYTDGMDDLFAADVGYHLFDRLPEVIWNDRSLVSKVRWQFHDWVTERFANAYFGQLQKWCQDNGLMLTGHVMRESKLIDQTRCVGETMRLYPKLDLPGLDILAARHEYSTAKQVQSVARQYGRPGVACELYGVTNWDYGFKDHKEQADWLMALGTNVRIPHLAWMSMGGESKRDYPAPLDEHMPWHSRYKVMEDYFSRICFAMSQGNAKARVAVVHPIESYWAVYGPDDQTGARRDQLETQFDQLIKWLLFGQIDFDFIAESLLPTQQVVCSDGKLKVGAMEYEAVVVPPLVTIRSTTLSLLEQFMGQGGRVICMGDLPGFADAMPVQEELFKDVVRIGFDQDALMKELELHRDVRLQTADGKPAENLLYQLREADDETWLFVAAGCQADDTSRLTFFLTAGGTPHLQIGVRGSYGVELCDAMNGSVQRIPAAQKDGWTWCSVPYYAQDSVLLHLTKACGVDIPVEPAAIYGEPRYLMSVKNYRLHEPNVLLLDMPQYRLDQSPWREREEILRLDDRIRQEVGYQKRTDAFPQPWLSGNVNPIEHMVELRYEVESKVQLDCVDLAFEADAQVFWNGTEISTKNTENYLDKMIRRISLGAVQQGSNELLLRVPFGPKTNLEACYLLGEFGVHLMGDRGVLTALPENIGFGDLCSQGFPFYGGNISYYTELECSSGRYSLCVPAFGAPLVDIAVDGKAPSMVCMEPYRVDLGELTAGKHSLELIAYGSRINQLGQVHNCCQYKVYYGPNSWRTKDAEWSYAYQLRRTGILATPFFQEIHFA